MMLLCFSVAIKAQDYALEQVASIATENLIGNSSPRKLMTQSAQNPIDIDTLLFNGSAKMFLCQDGTNWLIIANEQQVPAVVCYGEGEITVSELQESPLWSLLTESMQGLDSLRISGDVWEQDDFSVQAVSASASTRMTPLLDEVTPNRWGQSGNNSYVSDVSRIYNKFCPTFYNCADGRTYVGCTAVAMAQVMWYHQYPASAQIPVSINKAGIPSSSKETHYYDWSNMPGQILSTTPITQVDKVAGLLRDCGFAGNMIYASAGSSMTLTNAIAALRNDFNYEAHMKQYSSGARIFNNLIKTEIAARRPVIIQATHASDASAHSFVIDGYDSATDCFHLNMGWKGIENAWYSVSGSDCYNHYTVARRMLYEIQPSISVSSASISEFDQEIISDMLDDELVVTKVGQDYIIETENNITWMIVNTFGQVIMTGTSHTINASALPSGLYSINVSNGNESKTIKIQK